MGAVGAPEDRPGRSVGSSPVDGQPVPAEPGRRVRARRIEGDLGAYIVECCGNFGITVAEFAKRIGVRAPTASEYVGGLKHPGPRTRIAMLDAGFVTVEDYPAVFRRAWPGDIPGNLAVMMDRARL